MEYEVGDLLRFTEWRNRGTTYCIVLSKSKLRGYEICWIETGLKTLIYETHESFEVVSK
jgi:hypothetical protein